MRLTVELFSLLNEHLGANARMLIQCFRIEIPPATRALMQLSVLWGSEGLGPQVRSECTTFVLKGWNDLIGDFIMVIIKISRRLAVALLLLSTPSDVSASAWSSGFGITIALRATVWPSD